MLAAIKMMAKQPEFYLKLVDASTSAIVSAVLRKVVKSIFKTAGKQNTVQIRGPGGEIWEIEADEDDEDEQNEGING